MIPRRQFAAKVRKLRNFLVPEGKPHRLVRGWDNFAETKKGAWTCGNDADAARFCVLGGIDHLFGAEEAGADLELADRLCAYGNSRKFSFADKHSPKKVRAFLDRAAKEA